MSLFTNRPASMLSHLLKAVGRPPKLSRLLEIKPAAGAGVLEFAAGHYDTGSGPLQLDEIAWWAGASTGLDDWDA